MKSSERVKSESNPDRKRGLYDKYSVERLNDIDGKHIDCKFFVLDLVHDKFSAPALEAYADACEKEFPELARDLRNRFIHHHIKGKYDFEIV